MQVQFLKTKSLDEENYVDLISIDGDLHTMIMTKVEQPNVFGVKLDVEGDCFDEVTDANYAP